MKLKVDVEVTEAKGTPRRCLSFGATTEFVNIFEERGIIIAFVRKVIELLVDTVLDEEADFNPDSVVWNGNVAKIHIELRKRKSALQRECLMYREMNKPVLPEKFLDMVVTYK